MQPAKKAVVESNQEPGLDQTVWITIPFRIFKSKDNVFVVMDTLKVKWVRVSDSAGFSHTVLMSILSTLSHGDDCL